ncbi:transcription termination factor 4, mitochondrial [Petaurus breviceps papuanus]|uniref:transcription termination factor 4, mitochondrial n=1 Tax=Petaurus breviceps papuanus TaxID=3040969 RepID=UPI0036DAD9FD
MAASYRQVFRWRRLAPWPGVPAAAPPCLLGGALEPCARGLAAAPPGRSCGPPLSAAERGGAAPLESLESLGFSESRTKALLGLRAGLRPGQLLAVVSELLLLGLEPGPVCQVLQRNPGILQLSGQQLKQRADHLRRLGLGGGNLQHMTHCCPDLFTMSQQHIDGLISILKDRCLFTGQQVTEILHSCPRVLQEDPSALEYKFQYAYFRMGIKQRDLVKAKYFQYPMTKIKQRHIFLERLGLYQTPDKKGQTQICNPSLNSVLRVSEAEFLAKTAHSSWEEFEVFKQLLAREELEEGEGQSLSEDEDSDPANADSSADDED